MKQGGKDPFQGEHSVKKDMSVVATQNVEEDKEIFIDCRWNEDQMDSSSSSSKDNSSDGNKKPATKKSVDSNSNHLESKTEETEESKDNKEDEKDEKEEEEDD